MIHLGEVWIALKSSVPVTASLTGAVKMAPAFAMRDTQEWTVGCAYVSVTAMGMVSVWRAGVNAQLDTVEKTALFSHV